MKQVWIGLLLGCVVLSGCNGGNKLPESVVGVWKYNHPTTSGRHWGLKFERDGTISKMIHPVAGPIRMDDPVAYQEGTVEGFYTLFVFSQPEVKFEPKTRRLSVKVTTEHFVLKIPDSDITGKIVDRLDGIVAEDGKTWQVDWLNETFVEGATHPDPNINFPEEVTFHKIDMDEIAEMIRLREEEEKDSRKNEQDRQTPEAKKEK